MNWLIQNKEWVFSGIGVLGISMIVGLFNKSAKQKATKQKQKSGANSINIQAGGNYNQYGQNESGSRG